MFNAATAGYASLDNDALCIDADLIFDQLAEEDALLDDAGIFDSEPTLDDAYGEAALLGVTAYS